MQKKRKVTRPKMAKEKIVRKSRKKSDSGGEGYVKFVAVQKGTKPVPINQLGEINKCRNTLCNLGLIGIYTKGPFKDIGFGNVSRKLPSGNMIVTGTKTGGIKKLDQKHYCLVTKSFPARNRVWYIGSIKPTSESMTHAAIYKVDKSAKVVIHVHNLGLWKRLLGKVPTTKKMVAYGTPEMAGEIIRLFKETGVREKKIFVTAGHSEGIFTFGRNFEEAQRVLLNYFYRRQKV